MEFIIAAHTHTHTHTVTICLYARALSLQIKNITMSIAVQIIECVRARILRLENEWKKWWWKICVHKMAWIQKTQFICKCFHLQLFENAHYNFVKTMTKRGKKFTTGKHIHKLKYTHSGWQRKRATYSHSWCAKRKKKQISKWNSVGIAKNKLCARLCYSQFLYYTLHNRIETYACVCACDYVSKRCLSLCPCIHQHQRAHIHHSLFTWSVLSRIFL